MVIFMIGFRDWSLITVEGGYKTGRRGGHFWPCNQGGSRARVGAVVLWGHFWGTPKLHKPPTEWGVGRLQNERMGGHVKFPTKRGAEKSFIPSSKFLNRAAPSGQGRQQRPR